MQVTEFMVDKDTVIIANGVKTIQPGVLPNRQFTCIYIPQSVEKIYPSTIACNVVYDGILISEEEIASYGCENIPRMATFKKYQLDFTKMEKEVFLYLPLTNDAIKGYKANQYHYRKLHQTLITSPEEDPYYFKICYTLGLFMAPPKTRGEIEKVIQYVYNYGRFSNFTTLKDLELKEVDIAFIQFILGLYKNDLLLELMPYYSKLYGDCKQIFKIIKKRKSQILYELRKEKQEMESMGQDATDINVRLKELEENSKCITYQDVKEYFTDYVFNIRDGNEALEAILPIAQQSIYNQNSFDILQDIYEEAKRVKSELPHIFTPLIGQYNEYTYRWLENDDYENLILGYLVNCCAKLNHTGEDIMRLSMTHPQVRTLIVYDSFHKIIGKSTVFYSIDGKYLLGNNIEVAHSFILSSKTNERQKQELLTTFLLGLQAQASAMEKLGYMVKQIRVGMLRNNLGDQLVQYPIEKKDLLPNIKYGSYIGDASNKEVGQAVLPLEKEVKR